MEAAGEHEQVRVLIETNERTFRGTVHKPRKDETFRLSDHLNEYDRRFICLSDVKINERAMQHRPGDEHGFVAISISSITYITPIE